LLAIRFRNLLFVLPQQAANFLPNLFSFFIFFFLKNECGNDNPSCHKKDFTND
jgi:hypothetical protein